MKNNSQPFSIARRRYITWDECCKLTIVISKDTLIGHSSFTRERALSRIKLLSQYESLYGFVYFAELNWLRDIVTESTKLAYQDWVFDVLSNVVFQSSFVVEELNTLGTSLSWYTESLDTIWNPPELSESHVQFNNIKLNFLTQCHRPTGSQICLAFQILHNLSYHLLNIYTVPRFPDDVFLDNIIIFQDNNKWSIELIGEYGNVGCYQFVDELRV